MWSALVSGASSRVGRGPSFFVALRMCAAMGLLSCNFSDVVDIGRDDAGGAGGAFWMPSGGQAGTLAVGGAFGTGGNGGTGGAPDVCGVGLQSGPTWVEPQPALAQLTPGSGGPLKFGEYRLRRVMEHNDGACVRTQPLAQTLWIRDGSRGTLVTDYRAGGHFAASFTFVVGTNTIQVTPTCTDPKGPISDGYFGPFETYSASSESLLLVSATCNYSAEYEFLQVPAR